MNKYHKHDRKPDGESWMERKHKDSCNHPEPKTGAEKLKAIKKCECESHRVRRYTCHCGKTKTVKLRNP